jgi:hypothetical protein
MTEQEWLACDDLPVMLDFLRTGGWLSERKSRLFCVACCRQILRLMSRVDLQRVVESCEQFADGKATSVELREAHKKATAVAADLAFEANLRMQLAGWAAKDAAQAAAELVRKRFSPELVAAKVRAAITATPEEPKSQSNLLRDIFGPLLFREVRLDAAWLSWKEGTVLKLAQAIYDERAFDRLPILADALEEAGCSEVDILAHCRGPGPHVRGCWVVDLLLNKE